MSSKSKYSYLLILFLALFFARCDDGFEELNENPLSPTVVNYEALFNELVNSLRLGWNRQLFLHNEILYDVTEQGVVTARTFGAINAGIEDLWSNYYQALSNSRQLRTNMDELVAADLEASGIVKAQVDILMAYRTLQMVDLFGDIPYAEAGKAYTEEAIVRPRYDEGRTVYLAVLNDLKEASAFLADVPAKTNAGNAFLRVGLGDALFGDDLGRWVKFANSLALQHYLRIYDKEPDLVNTEVEAMITGGAAFINPGEDVVMSPSAQGWTNEGVNWSFREHNKLRLGTTMWDFMTEAGEIIDPRMHIFFEPNNNGEWVAFPQEPEMNTPQSGGEPYQKDNRDNNYDNKGEGNIYASFNFYLIRDEKDVPEILFTAAQVKFLLAEVFLRGIGVNEDASIASFRYQEGMLASMEFWQDIWQQSAIWVNQPDALSAGEQFQVTQEEKYRFDFAATAEDNLAKIYAQRWVDYFRQPWEAFALVRRTTLVPGTKDNDFYRFNYPVSESNFNQDNWAAQDAKMGGDRTNVRIWWMP